MHIIIFSDHFKSFCGYKSCRDVSLVHHWGIEERHHRNLQQHTTAKLVSSPEKPDSEWVTYLDSESQCYYEYNTINGESRWLTYEASQAIGIEKHHEIQSNY